MLVLGILGSLIFNKLKTEKEVDLILNDSELILIVEPDALIPHGWGWAYTMKVLEVLKGDLEEKSFKMDLNLTDEEIMSLKMTGNGQVSMAFIKMPNKKNYMPSGVSGFVDQNGTSWKMVLIY